MKINNYFLINFVIFLLLAGQVGAQSLHGIIRDSLTQTPIPYASILISTLVRPDSSIGGVTSDENGHFAFNIPAPLEPTMLQLRVSFIGYRSKIVENSTDSIRVFLSPELANLQEVLVYAYRQNLKSEVDQITYFVADDASIQDKSGLEALAKMPFIWLSPNQKLEYKYQKKLLILLNGKYYEAFQNSPALALQSIPASLIQKIELLSDPGIKYRQQYDAAVNIVAKGYLHGFTANANINTSYLAQRLLPNNSTFIYWQRYNLGVQANLSQSNNYNHYTSSYRQKYTDTQQNAEVKREERSPSHNADIALDFDLPESWSLNLYGAYGYNRLRSEGEGAYSTTFNSINTRFNTLMASEQRIPRTEAGLRLGKAYAQPNHQFYFSARQINSLPKEDVLLQRNLDGFIQPYRTFNYSDTRDLAVESGYSRPLSARLSWENAISYTLRNFRNDFRFDSLNFSADRWINLSTLSQQQNYRQEIGKLTQALKWRSPKVSINLILNTDQSTYSSLSGKQGYLNIYPSLRLRSKPAKRGAMVLDLSYRQIIRRPDAQLVGAYLNIQDPLMVIEGNPRLNQRIFHEFSLGLEGLTTKNKMSYYSTLEYSLNPKSILGITRYDTLAQRSVQTYEQIGNATDYALLMGGGYQVNEQLSLQLNNYLRYYFFSNQQNGQSNQGFFDQLNLAMNANLWQHYSLSFNYTWFSRSPSIQGSETFPSRYFLSIGRSLWKNQGGVVLIGHNFFNLIQQKEIRIVEPLFQREDISTNLGRRLELSLYCRFGNLEVGGAKPPKRLGNADLQGAK
jgi:ferric enterobactin receptor